MPVDTVREFLRARPRTASYHPGVPADLPVTSLVHMLERSVARHGAGTALAFFGATTSCAALGRQVERAAEGLRRLGVRRGDRVAIVLPNCPQHVVAFYAVLRLGPSSSSTRCAGTAPSRTPRWWASSTPAAARRSSQP